MLEDNTSKFGTLVLVKQRTPLLPFYNKAVQVGRTVINFSVKAQHTGQSALEGSATKFAQRDKLKDMIKPSSESSGFDILGKNLPMASPEVNEPDHENQAM